MTTRDQQLLDNRPIITSIRITDNMSADERFQSITLRPIIKLQNDLLIEVFKNYIRKHKNAFYALSIDKSLIYIANAINKDIKFRNSIKGMIIGQFTIEEYLLYIENSSALNKRMMNIVKQRLQDNVMLFTKHETSLAS